jgi:hypothetical protein
MSVYRVGTNKSSTNVFPSIRPTLDLDFANTKTLDPRITFTRASGGSYVGADGLIKYAGVNEARFDHDPVTGESLGLLIEEARTNLFTRSDIEGTVGSTPTNAVVPYTAQGQSVVVSTDVFLGPNGQSAKHTKGSQGDTNIGYYNSSGLTVGQIYCASIWLYISSSQANNFAGKSITFQPGSTPSATNVSAASYNTNLVNVWQRAFCVFTAGSTNVSIIPRTNAGAGSFFYTDAWQLELGSFPTSYIPTQASTRTRAADNASITGKNFSSWYRQDEGTVYCSFYPNTISTSSTGQFVFAFADEITQNTLNLLKRANIDFSTRFSSASTNGINNSFINVGTWSTDKTNISGSYKENNFAAVKNGSKVIANNLANLPININKFNIGSRLNQSYLNGTISRLTYFPKRLPNAQLQALTR